jgi:hypothetical protein
VPFPLCAETTGTIESASQTNATTIFRMVASCDTASSAIRPRSGWHESANTINENGKKREDFSFE